MKKMKYMHKLLFAAVAVLIAVPAVLAQGTARTTAPVDSLTAIRTKGELKVGVSIFEPWVMRDKQGDLIGYEIEVARQLAEDLGVSLKIQPVGFEGIIGDLNSGRFDVIITGMYATPERALSVNFTEPMNYSNVEFVANSEKADGRNSIDDFNKSDVTIGFVAGTVYGDIAARHFPNAKTQIFGEELEMFAALQDGKIMAAIASTPAPEIYQKLSNKKVKVAIKEPLARYGESLAVRKGDMEFLNYLNTWVRYYRDSEWLHNERNRWFVEMDWLKEVD